MSLVLLARRRDREVREAPVRRRPVRHERDRPGPAVLLAAKTIAARLAEIPPPLGLTPREAELLPWLATDLGYAAIAQALGYGPDNARLLAKRLLRKLGVTSRPAAVARWLASEAFTTQPTVTLPERVD